MRVFLFVLFCIFVLTLARRHTYKNGGTYRYVNKQTKETHYVGATNNFERRHSEHKKADYYASSNYKYVTNNMPKANKHEVAREEKRQIHKYKPNANKNKGGGGL